MALFRGTLIGQASGSVAGNTFSRNRGGQYIRNRAVPVNPNSPQQVAVRNALSQLSTAWGQSLTATQRMDWDVYAQNVPVLNRLGDIITLTGFNMYIRCNTPRLQAGLSRIDDGPSVFDLGSFTPVTTLVVAANDTVTVSFTNTDDWANETGAAMLVYISRSLSQTINFFKGPFRFGTNIDGDDTTAPTSPVVVNSPFTVAASQQVFTRVTVTRADGRLSNEQIVAGIAT